MTQIEHRRADELHFDWQNPRLVEFNITKNTTEKNVINILWSEMAVNEIVMSILAHGFFDNEAMYIVREGGKDIVVEGNRRLAAVKAILNPDIVNNHAMKKFSEKITPDLAASLYESLPVILLQNREDAWRYVGFKHVNGAAKWNSYAKAKYISTVHNDFGIPLESIAEQIGDTNKTVEKLYQALMVLEQADRNTSFRIEDTYNGRIYFSYLQSALGYPSFRDYLGVVSDSTDPDPVPAEKLPCLDESMLWLYGSRARDCKPVISSQNPDLKNLISVLENRQAVDALRATGDLLIALEMSYSGIDVLSESLMKAKVSMEKASSKAASYDGSKDILSACGTVATIADDLYEHLKAIYTARIGKERKSRITD